MSQGQHGPTYSLYGVICHGSSPSNSGHYYAHVKSAKGAVWHEMNEESVKLLHLPHLSRRSWLLLPKSCPQSNVLRINDPIPQADDDEDLGEKASPSARGCFGNCTEGEDYGCHWKSSQIPHPNTRGNHLIPLSPLRRHPAGV